ncbi:galactose-1-phosphate uridylyltransferase [Muribaculaceae bacterium]|nr:galactose-1-phosphate uridylyltransferase [Muribaculaceae bacterium]
MIQQDIRKLVEYGLKTGLVEKEDEIYTVNRLLELFELDEIEDKGADISMEEEELEEVLGRLMDYAVEYCNLSFAHSCTAHICHSDYPHPDAGPTKK